VALGQGFSEYFGFPCQFPFHRLLHTLHHLSPVTGTTGQLVADVPRGLGLSPPQEVKKNAHNIFLDGLRKSYENCHSGLLMSRPRIVSSTSRIQIYSVTAKPTCSVMSHVYKSEVGCILIERSYFLKLILLMSH
jgi:hypothetical protein